MIQTNGSNSIDIENEQLLGFSAAAKYVTQRFPGRRSGRGLHLCTVHRWASRGLKGIRLESIQCGGTRFTSVEALWPVL